MARHRGAKPALYLLVESESELLEYLVSTSTFSTGHGKVLIHPRNPTTIKPTINTYGMLQPQCNMMRKLSLRSQHKGSDTHQKLIITFLPSTLHACNILIKVNKRTLKDPSSDMLCYNQIKQQHQSWFRQKHDN